MTDLATEFEAERDHLTSVAYRMLGSRAEAEDAVQDAWLRYASADRAQIRDPRGWLTTTTGRICLDVLRSARVRREAYVGPWLPEPIVERLPAVDTDPAERAARTDQVGLALLVVMERLTPEQRVAFVLHDMFAVPFDEIAGTLGVSAAAARQLASRARRAVADGGPRHTAGLAEQRRVVQAFLAAADRGDLRGLIAVLDPDGVAISDGGGHVTASRRPVLGAEKVARFVAGLWGRREDRMDRLRVEPVLVNGDFGLLIEGAWADGRPYRQVASFAVTEGRITGLFSQLNPEKLARVQTDSFSLERHAAPSEVLPLVRSSEPS
ncbi:RNA polymerase sigma factor SigJ [Catenuloplanes japonicus]|uniref:RNA polymerase sigma factor SigJ n=1 Tax=Catenuloplanes japonicus TaxID=33876 RepID=UPI0007C4DFAA|nr:RNA polymerase sigma factor SigJ [Catenuloplanes japonicus]